MQGGLGAFSLIDVAGFLASSVVAIPMLICRAAWREDEITPDTIISLVITCSSPRHPLGFTIQI